MAQRLLALLVFLAGVAQAQQPLNLGLGKGDDEDQVAVRIADDPREQIRKEQQTLLKRQQELPWKEAEAWAAEQAQVRTRRLELERQRAEYLSDVPPLEAAREWRPEGPRTPDVAPAAVDAGAPDAGEITDDFLLPEDEPDAGADGGADAGFDAGVATDAGPQGDGGPDALPVDAALVDAAVPDAAVDDGTRLLALHKVGDQFLQPRIHPEEIVALDAAIAAFDANEQVLGTLQRLHNEQAAQLSSALAQADALLQLMDARANEEARTEPYGLREVERLALQVHLARIEDALARARQRDHGRADAAASTASDRPDEVEVQDVEDPVAYVESVARADKLRASARKANLRVARLAPRARFMREQADQARVAREALDGEFARRDLADRERTLTDALDSMRVRPEELEWTKTRLERSKALRKEGIGQIEEELDSLRTAAAHAAEGAQMAEEDIFADGRVRAKRIQFLKEKLGFERLKLERDQLWFDLASTLNDIIDGQPPVATVQALQTRLEPRRIKARQIDLETRCDGWRRAGSTAGREEPAPGKEFNKELLEEVYTGLADLCMRQEWVLGTQSRLANIAQFHFKRLEWGARGVWWYAWRVVVSLLLLALITLITRALRKVTRQLAGTDAAEIVPQGPGGRLTPSQEFRQRFMRLRGTLSLLLYLGSVSFLWMFAIIQAGQWVWRVPLTWASLLGWASYAIFMIGNTPVSIWSIVQVIIWTLAGVWTSRMVQNFVTHSLLDHFAVERGIRDAVGTMIRYLVIAVGIAVGLASVGIGLGALGLLFGVIGIGIGFGLQNIASNFISGFILLFERPIRRGDFVQVGDLIGEVKDISARATTIETRDAITVIVPNSEFISGQVVNLTLGRNERVRSQVRVGVAYGSDVDLVERTLLGIARQHREVLARPQPAVHMIGFADSSLDFTLHIWTRQIRELPRLLSDLNKQVDAQFAEAGIKIPYPQRTIHHLNGEGDDEPFGVEAPLGLGKEDEYGDD